jgi:hypothetical protein
MISAPIPPMYRIRIAVLAALCAQNALTGQVSPQGVRRAQDRIDEALRRESDVLVRIGEAAMAGRSVPTDFTLEWHNDFFKAQPGTFVPFTVTFTAPDLPSRLALLYVRVDRQTVGNAPPARRPVYETIFPVQVEAKAGEIVSVSRGFAVPAGRYRVVLVLRESTEDHSGDRTRKVAILVQELFVPDLWTEELAISTVMLARRVEKLAEPVPSDELDEDPYAVGSNRIHVTQERAFPRHRELIVAFLIYNPSIGPDKHFDVQVDYHLYRKEGGPGESGTLDHPPARHGERYVTRTNPQRFNPSLMGAPFDPVAGTQILAGQGILLSGFEPGEYRLGITVTDLLSRRALTRDVVFSVTGS